MVADKRCLAGVRQLDPKLHRATTMAGLAVRRWILAEAFSAFTVNFMEPIRPYGLPTVPFPEASKAMARGIGYAGEGDVLTSALMGAVVSSHPDTTFTEMFCPDWKHDTVFLSHMAEWNIALAAGRPMLVSLPHSFLPETLPVVAVGGLRPGNVFLANVAPLPDDQCRFIATPGVIIPVKGKNRLAKTIHGWFQPAMPMKEFLRHYSMAGGTHHGVLVCGNTLEQLVASARTLQWDTLTFS
jgi:L-arabinose isomerase